MNLVSIIIPCYNGEATIARALDSVLAQTYKNFEALVIDDGSVDGSAAIVSAYAKKDSRIRLIQKPNGGVSSARNCGLIEAKGDFIAFLDADDEYFPDNLAVMVDRILSTESDGCACNFTGNPMFRSYLTDRTYDLTSEEGFLDFYQETFGIMVPWNKMYRREVVRNTFDEEVAFNEDELFGLSQLLSMKKMATVSQVLYVYHIPTPVQNTESATDEVQGGSCINQMGREKGPWETKSSFWYKCRDLLPRRRAILETAVKEGRMPLSDPETALHPRMLDLLFWEFSAYAFMGVPEEGLSMEVRNVFSEVEFRRAVAEQTRFGVCATAFENDSDEALSDRFTALCIAAQRDILSSGAAVDFPKVFFGIFLRLFCEDNGQTTYPISPLARMQLELRDGVSPEARYVETLLREAMVCVGI